MNNININRLGFLIGAGVSIPVGMHNTWDITKQILSGKNIMRHTNSKYYFGDPLYSHLGLPDEYVPGITDFIELIKKEIEDYYSFKGENHYINYEDIYNTIEQLYDSEYREFENPAVQPFIDIIKEKSSKILDKEKYQRKIDLKFNELVSETLNYIRDIIWRMLDKSPKNYSKLSIFREIAEDENINFLDIFTLNHDLVLEKAFSNWKMDYNNGFSKPINNIKYWDESLIYQNKEKIKILKLHGSINWFRFRPLDRDWSDERIGIPKADDFFNTVNPEEKAQLPTDGRPLFLVGTFNKMLQYTSGIYTTLFSEFNRSMNNSSILLVSGYGFGDKGINNRIIEWIYSLEEKHIIIIHPDPEDLLNSASGAISRKWNSWIKSNKLLLISKGIEEVKWPEVKEKIARNFR